MTEKKRKVIRIIIFLFIVVLLLCISFIKIGNKRHFILSKEVSVYSNTSIEERESKKLGWFPLLEKVYYTDFHMSDINWVSKLNPKVKWCSVSGSGFNKMD